MIRQMSTRRHPAGQGQRARSEDARGGGGGLDTIPAEEPSSDPPGGGDGDGDGGDRPGVFRQLSESLFRSGRSLVRRNSFTGLASPSLGSSGHGGGSTSSASLQGLRNRGSRGGSMLAQASVQRPGGIGRRGRQRSTSFDGGQADLAYRGPSTERDILEFKIQEKDDRVKNLTHEQKESAEELRRVQQECARVRRQRLQDDYLRRLQVHRLKREHKAMAARVKVYRRDMHDKESLHGYAELIKGAAPTSTDSTYVMRLQSQLSKAIKKMEAMQEQMRMVQQTCDEVMLSLNEEINDVIEEKCKVEIELKDQMAKLEKEKAEMEKEFQDQLAKEEEQYQRLKQKENPDVSSGNDDVARDEKDQEEKKKPAKKSKEEQIDELKKDLDRLAEERETSERKLQHAIRKKKEDITRIQQMNELEGDSLRRLQENVDRAALS